MGKTIVVNQNSLVTDIMTVGGVNKENATSIFNIFTKAWNLDKIGMLKAVDSGIAVKRTAARPTKKVTKKATSAAPIKKAAKKLSKKVKTSAPVAKAKTKGKKKLKSKKLKTSVPATKATTQTSVAA